MASNNSTSEAKSLGKEGTVMAKTFNQMVTEAMAEVPVVNPAEAHQRIQEDPRTLVIDPRDAADIPATGIIPEAMNKTALAPLLRLAKVGNWGVWLVNS
jgi:hypothetical protein